MLAPPEGLGAPGLPGVNPGGGSQESGSDSKGIEAKKNFGLRTHGHTDGQTDVLVEIVC